MKSYDIEKAKDFFAAKVAYTTVVTTLKNESALAAMLNRQRAAFLRDGPPSLAQRRSDLMKLKRALQERREDFVAAINADFGHRSRQETSLLEMATVVDGVKYLHRNLARWMRPEKRRVALHFLPGRHQDLMRDANRAYLIVERLCLTGTVKLYRSHAAMGLARDKLNIYPLTMRSGVHRLVNQSELGIGRQKEDSPG